MKSINQMTKAEKIAIQQDLIKLGYLPPLRADGKSSADGIFGPRTEAAYAAYWDERNVETQVPVVTPAPATPWWASKGIWGSFISLVAVVAGILGYTFDPKEATDAILPLVELIPLVLTAIGGALAWWGRVTAKAPIDPTLVAHVHGHDLRLPSRVRSDPVPTGSRPEHKDPRGHFGE